MKNPRKKMMSYSGKLNCSKEYLECLILLAEIFRILYMRNLSRITSVIIHLKF